MRGLLRKTCAALLGTSLLAGSYAPLALGTCREAIDFLLRYTLSNTNQLAQAPIIQGLAGGYGIGVLVRLTRMVNGQEEAIEVFGIGRYLDGHRAIVRAINTRFPGWTCNASDRLWAGELQFVNGRLTIANETTGLLRRASDVQQLRRFLMSNAPNILATVDGQVVTDFRVYSETNQHLDTRINALGANPRHAIGSFVGGVMGYLELTSMLGAIDRKSFQALAARPDAALFTGAGAWQTAMPMEKILMMIELFRIHGITVPLTTSLYRDIGTFVQQYEQQVQNQSVVWDTNAVPLANLNRALTELSRLGVDFVNPNGNGEMPGRIELFMAPAPPPP